MKKGLSVLLALALTASLAACGSQNDSGSSSQSSPAPDASQPPADVSQPVETPPDQSAVPQQEELTVEDQLALIAASAPLWAADDEHEWWAYAVTDMDQNGRLEVVSTEVHGTGRFVTTRFWEVSESGTELVHCAEDENCPPRLSPMIDPEDPEHSAPIDVLVDNGTYYMLTEDFIKDGPADYYHDLRAVALKNGAMGGRFLGGYTLHYEPDGSETVTYYDTDNNTITQEDYDSAAALAFPDAVPMSARIQWFEQVVLAEQTPEALTDLLQQSWEDFSMTEK